MPTYKTVAVRLDSNLYENLRAHVGKRKMSELINDTMRSYLAESVLSKECELMSQDEEAEREALEWSESAINSIDHETFETW